MRSSKPWVQALNIDPHKVKAWALEVPRHESVTFWCLERGHLRSKEYFDWAREHFGLAQVDDEYFKTPANRELWYKIQSVANWSAELLPLEEWDGIVFVACVEPPEDIQWSFPVQYLLASAANLKSHWERLQAEPTRVSMPAIDLKSLNLAPTAPIPTQEVPASSASSPAASSVKLPELNLGAPAPAAAPPTTPAPASAPTVKPAPAAAATPAAASTAAPPAPVPSSVPATAVDSPEGLKVNFELNLNVGSSPDALSLSAEPQDSVDEAPAGLTLNIPSMTSGEVTKVSDVPEGLSIAPDHAVFEQDDIPTGLHANPLLQETAASAPAPLPPPPVMAQPAMSEDTTGFTMVTSDTKNDGAIDSDTLAPARFEAAKNESERLAWIFQQLKQHFKHSWIMYINNEKLVPWKWDKAVVPKSQEASQPIDLHQPSLFRVVFRTKMPYHGPVISNLINTSFFKNWGLKTTPGHVTAVPIVMDGILVAMLIASGNTPEQSDHVLRFVEKLTPAVINSMSQKAAA